MEIEGMIVKDLGVTGGESKATGNPWTKHEWILEQPGQFPKKVKLTAFGERAQSIVLEVGKFYVVSVDIESREWNEKWFTDVRVYNYRPVEGGQPAVQQPFASATPQQPAFAQPAPQQPFAQQPVIPQQDDTEDLPF